MSCRVVFFYRILFSCFFIYLSCIFYCLIFFFYFYHYDIFIVVFFLLLLFLFLFCFILSLFFAGPMEAQVATRAQAAGPAAARRPAGLSLSRVAHSSQASARAPRPLLRHPLPFPSCVQRRPATVCWPFSSLAWAPARPVCLFHFFLSRLRGTWPAYCCFPFFASAERRGPCWFSLSLSRDVAPRPAAPFR